MGMRLESRYYVVCDRCGREATNICCRTHVAAKDVARLAGFVHRLPADEWLCPFCADEIKVSKEQSYV